MFSPPKLTTIIATLTGLMTVSSIAIAQDADYNRRLAAMQQARERGTSTTPNGNAQSSQVRVAANTGYDYSTPPVPVPPARVAQAPTNRRPPNSQLQRPVAGQRIAQLPQPVAQPRARVAQASNSNNRVNGGYRPAHLRTAQLNDGPIIGGGAPVMDAGQGVYEEIVGDEVVGDEYYDEMADSSFGDTGGYFDCGDSCNDRGGCPPGPCWLSGLGAILYNGDFFGGAQGFQNQLFTIPGTTNSLVGDSSFGFYGGVNYGIPLCNLTCGVLSGQFGVRTVQTNFDGNQFSNENRDQLFMTAGFYRRVDYGLQGGIVADILNEDWFSKTQTVQARADLGWVWPGGTSFGFRYADNIQDDTQPATISGRTINSLRTFSQDYYRFYLHHEACAGGYGEMFFGWTDAKQTIFGMESDLPITDTISAQATFTYFLDGTAVPANSGFQGGHLGDAWNVAVGFAWRPQGRSYYRSYDRPLFNVADNGSMLITRQ